MTLAQAVSDSQFLLFAVEAADRCACSTLARHREKASREAEVVRENVVELRGALNALSYIGITHSVGNDYDDTGRLGGLARAVARSFTFFEMIAQPGRDRDRFTAARIAGQRLADEAVVVKELLYVRTTVSA